ncbi:MAG: phosphate ABC transporter permease PstA [Phenylobacterium sp.]|jgi:phosphate transport system permease protein|uniref:phosphate ABC transporter permease PstA n=1 Tax=Phenylobacterium sp. TaxID=1871053 RepID=UPI0025FCE224|nr:phosphate ABC transporter permease PstA [Phenylobacterium sp.]MCA3709662.1 phosphate ABC transporter permease PstA [Phenylobacterium sp.]MCA3731510.1 phosphate ABC transporter permease PstA [Phenylobacterium sp.]MCA3735563.1 phosphate ABC transporter permease PstA [Phenylobacterium sp.]MCA3737673.1 phosphate ABC transporter permease PstA [Phenylobacterium sp.]MCA3758041.1 phosphate ABC transporter permease PstA [Phenylobacterium sp.]
MTEIRPASDELRAAVARRLKARNAAERRFQLYGRIAIAVALGFLLLLLGRIVQQGWSTFVDYRLTAQVYVDPARIDPADPGGANYDLMIAEQLLKRIGVADDEFGTRSDAMKALLSGDLGFQVLDRVKADPSVIGKTLTLSAPLKADAGLYFKGQITRATPEDERPLTSEQLDWLDRLNAGGLVKSEFNTTFLTRSDSTEPEQAGVLGAVVGSALMLLLTAALAIPIGVLAATYLEEFAPKNRWTDMVEVNINNLAAVPSIVYGLLGLAVFINWMNVPRSSPLVGGLVLALMSLPTVIIATRSALRAVPPSIREAALALGASRTQTVFHHVLPLALPGVMTGAILSLAHALGETAPLLMVGMVSFVPGVPDALTSASTVLPVQIFIWENASERAFQERTAAAIMVLLAFMIIMNLAAVLLRRRFERRW